MNAPLRAQKLALEQRVGDGAAVDLDERAAAARAGFVDGASDDLFAGAAFAGHQDGRIGRGNQP